MKWLGLSIALVAASGCCLEVVQGNDQNNGSSTTGGRSVGTSSGGRQTTGAGAGSSSGQRGSSGGSSTGGSVNGGGTCDPPCGANATCITDANGASSCQCYPLYEACPASDGTTVCVNIELDNDNCGGCGNVCTNLEECLGATCSCIATVCVVDGGGDFCVDTDTDPNFCGSCGNTCLPVGTPCINGMCNCPMNETYCLDTDPTQSVCTDTLTDSLNCGTCNDNCAINYAHGSSCSFGFCACDTTQDQLCVVLPGGTPPSCDCQSNEMDCAPTSFARDVYPFLAQQTGVFGCSASGCHTGTMPSGGLGFLDALGHQDAGMAYGELVGDGGLVEVPGCDGGELPGVPSTQCNCVSRVAPGNIYGSYLVDVIANDIPGTCANSLPMPTDGFSWSPLVPCSQALIAQWVATGAAP